MYKIFKNRLISYSHPFVLYAIVYVSFYIGLATRVKFARMPNKYQPPGEFFLVEFVPKSLNALLVYIPDQIKIVTYKYKM